MPKITHPQALELLSELNSKGLTDYKIAQILDVNPSSISRIRSGKITPSQTTWIALNLLNGKNILT